MTPETPQQCGQIVFAYTQLIIVLRGAAWLAPSFQQVMAHFLEDGFVREPGGGRSRLRWPTAESAVVGHGGRSQTRLGLVALQAGIQLLDF